MTHATGDRRADERRDAEIMREAWLLAASRMPRLSWVIFQLHVRDRTYARIARMLRVSERRVRRSMVDAIMHIDRAACEIAAGDR